MSIKFCYNLQHNKAVPLCSTFSLLFLHCKSSRKELLPLFTQEALLKPPPHIFFPKGREKKSILVIDHCLFSLLLLLKDLLMCISLCEMGGVRGSMHYLWFQSLHARIHTSLGCKSQSSVCVGILTSLSTVSSERKTGEESMRSFDFNAFIQMQALHFGATNEGTDVEKR